MGNLEERRESGHVDWGYIVGDRFGLATAVYEAIDGLAFFEGDIVLGTEADLRATRVGEADPEPTDDPTAPILGSVPRIEMDGAEEAALAGIAIEDDGSWAEGVAITGPHPARFRWPVGEIPYENDGADASTVADAIRHWEQKTAIRFIRRTTHNANQYSDYLRFFEGTGCWSMVGRRGGMQELSLSGVKFTRFVGQLLDGLRRDRHTSHEFEVDWADEAVG